MYGPRGFAPCKSAEDFNEFVSADGKMENTHDKAQVLAHVH